MKEGVEVFRLLGTRNEEKGYDVRGLISFSGREIVVDADDGPTVVSSGVKKLKSVEHEAEGNIVGVFEIFCRKIDSVDLNVCLAEVLIDMTVEDIVEGGI